MVETPGFRTGEMPDTDARYEEFEGLLGSYFLSLLPLREGSEQDKADFQAAIEALDKLADGQGVQRPEIAVAQPRGIGDWAKAHVYSSSDLLGSFRAFYSDFGVGIEPGTPDFEQRLRLIQTVLGVLDRHGVIKAEFEEREGRRFPVGVVERNGELIFKPLQEVLKATV